MPLNNYQKMCYRWFGSFAESVASDKIKHDLERAHIEMRPGAYLSYAGVNTIFVAIAASLVYINIIIFLSLETGIILLLIFIPVLATILTYLYYNMMPSLKAKARAKKIDMHLPYALNFISVMSSAGVTPTDIFKSLSKQELYGEVKQEALWIYRDVALLGKDIVSSMKANIDRTPSHKLKEFLQGAVVTVQSGGALKPYFMTKADQYMRENRLAQKQMIESLGVMAECYVTAAVAGILLVIVIVPLMMIISNEPVSSLNSFGFLITPVVLMIHIMFAFVLFLMSERV